MLAVPPREDPGPVPAESRSPGSSKPRAVRRYTENEARYVKGLLKEGGEAHLRHAALLLHKWLVAGECKKGCSDTFYHLLAVRRALTLDPEALVPRARLL